MKIKDVLAKVAEGSELTDAEKEFISSYEEPDVDAVANARGKKERLKLEKRVAEAEALIAEKEAELEAASEGSSEMEKLQKQLEKAQAKIEKAENDLKAANDSHSKTLRDNAIKSLNVPWLADVPNEYRDTVMQAAFADIDTEDLSDGSVTKPILDKVVETQARFINSGVSGGSGSNDAGKSIDVSNKWTREKVQACIAAGTYSENREAIMSALATGELNE